MSQGRLTFDQFEDPLERALQDLQQRLQLRQPLLFFDLEATGVSTDRDRIVEIAVVRVGPDGQVVRWERLVNPGMPIPAEASAVHGIHDADVAGQPTFKDLAWEIAGLFAGSIAAGYNIRRFDLKMMAAEMKRAGVEWKPPDRVIDAFTIFQQKEPRDLSAAAMFYAGMTFDGHRAFNDVEATVHVLRGQLDRYTDLPPDVERLHEFCAPVRDASWIDQEGKLAFRDGEARINFGKNQGRTLRELASNEPSFLEWVCRADFPDDTKAIIRAALKGQFPTRPAEAPAS